METKIIKREYIVRPSKGYQWVENFNTLSKAKKHLEVMFDGQGEIIEKRKIEKRICGREYEIEFKPLFKSKDETTNHTSTKGA